MTREVKDLVEAAVAVLNALGDMDAMDKDVDLPYLEKRLSWTIDEVEFVDAAP